MSSSDKQLGGRFAKGVPFSAFQYVDVEFSGANVDALVLHELQTDRPDDVRYEVVGRDRAGDVYHDGAATRRAWKNGYLFLRCATADARVRLRLSIEA